MLAAKEKLEDIRWLEELYALMPRTMAIEAGSSEARKALEIMEEIDKLKHKIATHDYAPLEARRQASIRRLGKESAYY